MSLAKYVCRIRFDHHCWSKRPNHLPGYQLRTVSEAFHLVHTDSKRASDTVEPMVTSKYSGKKEESMNLELIFPFRTYAEARKLKRDVHLHIGPTNSGKSYTALLAFKGSKSGYYAGPLRMLAREVFDRVNNEGIACNLVTGDEILEKNGATLNSCTVEMMNLNIDMDVAVIDEIQMINDPDRGSTWTQALLGVRAKTLHLCGDPNSEPIVKKSMKETGDVLTVHRYERSNKLDVENVAFGPNKKPEKKKSSKPHNNEISLYKTLRAGDCVVAFTKNDVQNIRDKIVAAQGRPGCCAVIYGSLPPDIRAEQCRLFNDEDSGVDFLVASDAIGMGLNLAIKRIIFTALSKFDGKMSRTLDIGEIKQIAGRAGRFRTLTGQPGENGKVACLNKENIKTVKSALAVRTPSLTQAYVKSSKHALSPLTYDNDVDFSTILMDWYKNVKTGANYHLARVSKIFEIAEIYDHVRDLTFEERVMLVDAPVSNDPTHQIAFLRICSTIGTSKVVNVITLFPDVIENLAKVITSTQNLEKIHKVLSLYLWFSYRFPCNFIDRESAVSLRRSCEQQFSALLGSKKASASKKPPKRLYGKKRR